MTNPSRVGRVAGLAAAVGVGTAMFTGCAIASADSAGRDSSGASVSGSPARGPARPARSSAQRPIGDQHASAAAASVATDTSARATAARPPRSSPVVGHAPAMGADARAAQTSPHESAVNPDAMPPKPDLRAAWVSFASAVTGVAQAGLRTAGIAGYLGPTQSTLNQTLDLNGYQLVPSSTERVTSFYGQWTYWPGGPTLMQGQQQYSVVDPVTKASAGNFDALVSTGSPFNVRSKYVELLVTANDGTDVGAGAGQLPPVGSLISSFHLIGGFGWSYSAMPPTPASPGGVVAFALLTPFGKIPIPFKFNAANGIADHTVDNRPVRLGNGYSIAPASPAGEIITGTSGFLPYYTTVQGREVFEVRDPSGNTVGSFEGVLTPTTDVAGVYTQAILVTAVTGGTAGTTAGDVPPVGSVFNVMYQGSDSKYVLYSSLPSPSGDVVSLISVDGDRTRNIRTFPLDRLDASALPVVTPVPAGKGYSYLPISPLLPSGVNGLPPREIQVQGYQQFGVYDSAGVQCGSFDADVSNQLDMFGIHSQAILVTGDTDGIPGTAAGDVPPVGSVINLVHFGNSGFGTYYSALPSPSGTKVSFKFLTPLFDIPTWSTYDATAGLSSVSLVDPFGPGGTTV